MAAISSQSVVPSAAFHHPVPSSSSPASSSTSSPSTPSGTGEFERIQKIWEEVLKSSKWTTELETFHKHFAEISATFAEPILPPPVIKKEEEWRIPTTPVDVNFQIQKLFAKIRESALCPVSKVELEGMKWGLRSGFSFQIVEQRLKEMNEFLKNSTADKKREIFIDTARYFARAQPQEEIAAVVRENSPNSSYENLFYENLLYNLNDLTASLKYPLRS